MTLLFKHAWILCIVVSFVNYLIIKSRVQKHIDKNSELKEGYDMLARNFLIYGNIPWLIMGIGDLSATTNNVFDYFRPALLNPVVLAFHASIIILWLLCLRWIYMKDGADFLVKHPGLFEIRAAGRPVTPSVVMIKILCALMLLGGMVGMVMMWTVDFPSITLK